MGLETGTYPTFVGGVSQQDDTVRAPSQLTEAVNTWHHGAMGTGKRPPATFVGVLASDLDPMAHFHSIDRDESERYIVAIGNRSIRVFDHITGHEYGVVVADGAAWDYLNTSGMQPWTIFKAATWADTTFIVNRNVPIKMADTLSAGTINGYAQTLADLPKGSAATGIPIGAIYHVTGSTDNPFDDYYVQKGQGQVWVECAKPGEKNTLDKRTMPHILKRIPDPIHGDGFYFSFGPPDWDTRAAGDSESNQPPSFVGATIREVFLHRNRLAFLSTENILMSETDKPYNLWRTSVTQAIDTDPIDIAVPTNGVAMLNHAVSYQSAVFVAGARSQHLLTADPYMAARYAKTDLINTYSSSLYLRPQMMGDSLYFVDDLGAYATVREYFMSDTSVTGDAGEVTAHVPRYVPGRIRSFAPATSADCVLFSVDNPRESQVYAYFVRWQGDEKAQSAWCRWTISGVGKVVHLSCINDSVYCLAEAPGGGVEMLRFDLMLNMSDSDATEDYQFLVDRAALVRPVYAAFGNYTDIRTGYILDTLNGVSVLKTDDWLDPGAYLDIRGATLEAGGQIIRIPGRHDDGRVVVGLDYRCAFTLTKPVIRQRDGSAILVGRTQVRDLEVAYKDAAYFEMEVSSKGTSRVESHHAEFNSRVLDEHEFKLSAPSFRSGTRRFPVLSNADNVRMTLVNPLPYQCWFQSAQWRGLFVTRSRV